MYLLTMTVIYDFLKSLPSLIKAYRNSFQKIFLSYLSSRLKTPAPKKILSPSPISFSSLFSPCQLYILRLYLLRHSIFHLYLKLFLPREDVSHNKPLFFYYWLFLLSKTIHPSITTISYKNIWQPQPSEERTVIPSLTISITHTWWEFLHPLLFYRTSLLFRFTSNSKGWRGVGGRRFGSSSSVTSCFLEFLVSSFQGVLSHHLEFLLYIILYNVYLTKILYEKERGESKL